MNGAGSFKWGGASPDVEGWSVPPYPESDLSLPLHLPLGTVKSLLPLPSQTAIPVLWPPSLGWKWPQLEVPRELKHVTKAPVLLAPSQAISDASPTLASALASAGFFRCATTRRRHELFYTS